MMKNDNNQPDWNNIAEKFDLFLPQLAPVGKALLSALKAQPGDHVIDLASGTGEPALTLAQQQPQVKITGSDAAEGMVKVAQKKAQQRQLNNINFETMSAEALIYEDNSFDKALCRFGVMLFNDPQQGLNEISRVLKPGGHFAFAVWSTVETMTSLHWAAKVFENRLPEKDQPPSAKVCSLGSPGAIEALLDQAQLTQYRVETKQFYYHFNNFAEYWDLIEASDIMKQQFDALPTAQYDDVRNEFSHFASEFQREDGLHIPHDYLLVTGQKPA